MNIQMVDLKGQYNKIKTEIDVAINEVISNTQFIKGPQIKQFEEALAKELNVKHVIACANGTDALQIAMMALDLKPGDEVILPVFTYVATAEVIGLLGLVPVMVDVEPETFCIDTSQIEARINSKTKAIVPVHLFGQCANMDEIMRIAKQYNLFVIEDTAQAIGAVYNYEVGSMKYEEEGKNYEVGSMKYKEEGKNYEVGGMKYEEEGKNYKVGSKKDEGGGESQEMQLGEVPSNEGKFKPHTSYFIPHTSSAGTIGHIGTTSFFPSKNLGCYGDGGAMMTNDDELAKKIRMICNHGQSVQYVHDVIGVNSRLDSIQAAVLNAKLPHLKSYEAARNQAANWYDELLGNHPHIIIPKRNPKSTHVFHQYTIRIMNDELLVMNEGAKEIHNSSLIIHNSKRDQIRKSLSERGIPSMVYYPIELHKQKAFAQYWDGKTNYPVSEQLCTTVLSLPMHTEMTREMVEYVCTNLIEVMDNL